MITLKMLRRLVESYPRANLTLQQVFALDAAKEYLKLIEPVYDSSPPSDGSDKGAGILSQQVALRAHTPEWLRQRRGN